MKPSYLFLFVMAFSSPAISMECNFDPGVSLCGLPLASEKSEFIKALGEPDGRIKMSDEREGLIYGQRIILIFKQEKLWQVQGWGVENSEFWGYVRNYPDRINVMLKIQGWSPLGAARSEVDERLKSMKILSEDQFCQTRKHPNGTLDLAYDIPLDEGFDYSAWRSYPNSHLTISFF